jgi:hypothetical protein
MDQFAGVTAAEVKPSFTIIPMEDFQASIGKLRKDAAEAALIRDSTNDPMKREMFERLSQHLNRLANEV